MTETEIAALEPCPFCGSDDVCLTFFLNDDPAPSADQIFAAVCNRCECRGPAIRLAPSNSSVGLTLAHDQVYQSAAEFWNKRA